MKIYFCFKILILNGYFSINHELSGQPQVGGQASDVEIQAREIIKMRERLNKIFASATGQTLDQIKKDTDRDYWMSAEQALAYGLVGKIVTTHAEIG